MPSATEKRKKYAVAARSPRTSALTVWSEPARATAVPRAATREKALSSAISQTTGVSAPSPEPGTASGAGVTRVHRRMPSGSGSPEATPCRKAGPPAARALVAAASTEPATAVAAAALTTVRRVGAVENCRLVTGDHPTDE